MTESILLWLYENHRRSSSSSIEMDPIINETFFNNLIVTDVGTKSIIDDVAFISNLTTINGTDEIGNTHTTNTNDPNMAYYGHIFSKLNSEYRSIHGYLSLVVCVFGIIANVLNIIVLTRRNMESPTNTILTGMAVSDLLVIASYIPYVIHNYIRTEVPPEQMYNYGWAVFTLFHAHNTVLFHTISIWLTVLLAVWRYITVRTPLRTRSMLTIVQARLYIMLVYIMVPIFCIPVFISFTIHKMDWTVQNRNISIYKVDIVHLEGKNHYLLEKITFWVFSVFLKLIPCGLLTWITLALIHILIEARKRKERLLKGNIGMNQNNNKINASSSNNNVNLSRNNSKNQLMNTPSIAAHPTASLYSQHHLHPNNQQHHHQQQQSLQHRYSQPVNSLTPRLGSSQQHLQVSNNNLNNSIRSNNDNKTNVHLEMETCLECDPSSTNSSKVVNSSSNDSSSAASDSSTSSSNNISNNNRTSFTKFCFRCGNCLQTTKRKFTSTTTMLKTNYPTTTSTTSNTTTTTMAAQQQQQSTQSKSKRQQKNNSKQPNLNNKIKLKFRSSSGCSVSGGDGGGTGGQSSSNICSSSSTSSSSTVAVSSTTTTLAANAATTTTTTTATNAGNPSSSSASTSSGNSERTTRMLIAVLIMFLVCEFPSGILALLSGILGKLFFKNVYNNFGDIMDMLALINSAVNFVLYCLMSQQFRKTFSHLFCIRWTEEISGQHHGSGVSGINRRTSGGSISKSRPITIKNKSNNNKCDQKKNLKHHHHNQKHQEITTTEFIESNSNENVCLLVNKNISNNNNNGQSSNGVDTIINHQTNLEDVPDNSFENDDQLSDKNGSNNDYNNIKMVMLNNGKNNNQNQLFLNKKIKCNNNNNNNNNNRIRDNDNSGNDLKHEKKLMKTAVTNDVVDDDDDDNRIIAIKNSTQQHNANFPSPTSVALKESNTINFATTIASATTAVAAGATILITDQHQRTTEIKADDVYDHQHNYDNQNNDDDHDDIDDAELNDCSTSV